MRMRLGCLVIALLCSACTSVSVPWRGAVAPGSVAPKDAWLRIPWAEPGVPGTQEDEEPPLQSGEESRAGVREEESAPPNSLVLFLGATHREETDPSFALTYVRRISPSLALGVTVEGTPSARELVALFPELILYPVGSLALVLSPGLEFETGGPLFLFRVGATWDFELGRNWALAPEFNYDFVSGAENAIVAGVGIVYRF